ncbi:electron transfer flavoprotein subunit alpha, partial [Salmonella enterica]|nr:electron transfer flavoprotein subunit alpha [Salmonella enterica]
MNHLANVWVFSDNVERYAELMTGARQWGEKVYAIVQGNTEIDYVKALGADEIVILESHTDLQRVENYAETLASLLGDKNGLLLMAATKRCKALGARLSIQLDAVMVNDATSIDLLDGTLHAEHRMYGGLAFGKEKLNSPQAIITLAPGVLEPAAPLPSHTCPLTTLAYIAPRHEVLCQQRRAKSLSSVDLSKAKRV